MSYNRTTCRYHELRKNLTITTKKSSAITFISIYFIRNSQRLLFIFVFLFFFIFIFLVLQHVFGLTPEQTLLNSFLDGCPLEKVLTVIEHENFYRREGIDESWKPCQGNKNHHWMTSFLKLLKEPSNPTICILHPRVVKDACRFSHRG